MTDDTNHKKMQNGETERLSDEKNPEFLFCTTHTDLLVQIVNGNINAKKRAFKELGKRGLNKDGRWVGFGLER